MNDLLLIIVGAALKITACVILFYGMIGAMGLLKDKEDLEE